MGEISTDLKNFKNSVKDSLADMKTCLNTISTSVDTLKSISDSIKTKTDSLYKSENKALVLSTFDGLNETYSEIKKSVDDTLKNILTTSESIISKVSELESINEEIQMYQRKVNNNNGDSEEEKRNKRNAQDSIGQKNLRFNEVHGEATTLLSTLKSLNDTINIEKSNNNNVEEDDIIADGGVFKKASYTAFNGKVVNYYMYVPNVSDSSTKLPMVVYFHGIQDTVDRNTANNFKYGGGLAGLVQQNKLQPKGIIIFPQATDGTIDREFLLPDYQKAVIELAYDVADKYNGDTKRLSVAGHSNGGAAVYHIVNNYPGVFSAAVPISCAGSTKEGIKQTKMYAFVGSNDHTMENPTNAIGVAKRLGQMYKVLSGRGHDIQTTVFEEEFPDENGNNVNILDWMMKQVLNS